MDKVQAYDEFWNRFGIVFYEESSVPDKEAYPYGTYESSYNGFTDGKLSLDASLWYRGRSWSDAMAETDRIFKFIGQGGVNVPYDNGFIWITRRAPFARRLGDESDDQIRRVILGVDVEFIDAE